MNEALPLIERAYEILADFELQWPNRANPENQKFLCGMLQFIAKETGRDEREVFEDFRLREYRKRLQTAVDETVFVQFDPNR